MSKIKDGNQIIFPKERPGRIYTPFEQTIVDVLEPIYQENCKTIQGYLDELPPGSYIGRFKDDPELYEVVIRKPDNGEIAVRSTTVASAYDEAMKIAVARRLIP